jgi:hypothetical protein
MTITPDKNIQKIFVPKNVLPGIHTDGTYALRYRVISEDGSQNSSWSPIYKIQKDPVSSFLTNGISVTPSIKSNGTSIDISWKFTNSGQIVKLEALQGIPFDIFIWWGSESTNWNSTPSWEYAGTTSSESISVTIPTEQIFSSSNKKYFKLMVHLSTNTKSLQADNSYTHLFGAGPISTQAIYDSGTIV